MCQKSRRPCFSPAAACPSINYCVSSISIALVYIPGASGEDSKVHKLAFLRNRSIFNHSQVESNRAQRAGRRRANEEARRVVLLVSVDAVRGARFRVAVCHPGFFDRLDRPAGAT